MPSGCQNSNTGALSPSLPPPPPSVLLEVLRDILSLKGHQALPTISFPDLGLTLLLTTYGSPLSTSDLLLPLSFWLWDHFTFGVASFQGGSRIPVLHDVNCSWEIFCILCPPNSGRTGCTQTLSCPALAVVFDGSVSAAS